MLVRDMKAGDVMAVELPDGRKGAIVYLRRRGNRGTIVCDLPKDVKLRFVKASKRLPVESEGSSVSRGNRPT